MSLPEYSASKEVVHNGRQVVGLDIYNDESRVVLKDRLVYFALNGGEFSFRMNGATWGALYANNYASFVESTKRERGINKEVLLNRLEFLSLLESPVVYIGEYNSNFLVTDEAIVTGKRCVIVSI